jgi:hypothetical protein
VSVPDTGRPGCPWSDGTGRYVRSVPLAGPTEYVPCQCVGLGAARPRPDRGRESLGATWPHAELVAAFVAAGAARCETCGEYLFPGQREQARPEIIAAALGDIARLRHAAGRAPCASRPRAFVKERADPDD